MNKLLICALSILSLSALSVFTSALELSPLIKDHMVLQRNKVVTLNGWASANTELSIRHRDLTQRITADNKGRWSASLPAHKAGGPFTLTVSSAKQSQTVKDIYYGDVWLASGQSNMEYKLRWDIDNWVLASPKTSPDFSAIAWFFTKRAHLDKNIPIGIIDSTWGGTPAEAWSPKETLLQNVDYVNQAQLIDENSQKLMW